MRQVTELLDSFPLDDNVRQIQRDEELLLTHPTPSGPMKLWSDYELLGAVSLPVVYTPMKFAPPKGVYESEYVRIEWQTMNFRQPFYHRNADVDEISYHVVGQRTVLTEKGSVDVTEGDFSRIPVTVAHDNYGVDDIHLLFYIPAPVTECVRPSRTAEFKIPPFKGWESNPRIIEMMTECLGGPHCDLSVSLADETLLLEAAKTDPNLQTVLRASGQPGSSAQPEWLYKSALIWLGSTTIDQANGDVYRRHRRADEIQYQVSGSRTLVTQRGTISLEPGDFISIPLGTAFTNIVKEKSTHLSVVTRWPTERKLDHSKFAQKTTAEVLEKLRQG